MINKQRVEERRSNAYISNSRRKRFYRGDIVEIDYRLALLLYTNF